MGILRWGPFRDVFSLQRGMNRMFDDMAARLSGVSGTRYPKLDLTETEEELRLRAELPGVSKDDVKISLTQDVLSISGNRRAPALPEGATALREERQLGPFERSIELPAAIGADQVRAAFKDGILTVTLHKREEARPREIQLQVQ